MKGIQKKVKRLSRRFGHCKTNLVHPDGTYEGVWTVPLDEKSKRRVNDDSSYGEPVRLVLDNKPLGWGNKNWGDEIIAETRGELRPITTLDMQKCEGTVKIIQWKP